MDVFYKDLTVQAIGQMKANRSACYNAGTISDSILSEPCELKALVKAEKSQKPLSYMYFLKRRKQWEDKSDKESTTTQVAHKDLTDVDDQQKKLPPKLKENSS